MDRNDPRSTRSLLSDVLSSIGALLRQEVDLARAEVDQNIRRAGIGLGLLAAAVALALVGLMVLASAAIGALVLAGLGQLWAALLVGLGVMLIAAILLSVGVRRLKLSSLAPTRAAQSLRADAQMMKEAYHER